MYPQFLYQAIIVELGMIFFYHHHFCINPLVLILKSNFGIILCHVVYNTPIHHKWITFNINQMNNNFI